MGNLLSRVTSTATALPSRVFLYAREKWGKSSLFAHAPGAIFFMTRGETGLVELIAGGRVPPTAHFHYDEDAPPSWETLRQAVRELLDEDHPHKALVVDTCNGAEILLQEHVRNEYFEGKQSKFASYGKGWETCRIEWLAFLQDLDALRARRKMAVVLLAHTQVKKFDDPTQTESYDKYRPACQEKLWDLTHKWSDIICFGHFEAQTYETEDGKTKARAQVKRVLCFDQSPLWEAGNRYGVTGKLDVGSGAKAAFAAFAGAVSKAKAAAQPPANGNGKPAAPATPPPAAKPEGEKRADFPPATTDSKTSQPAPTPTTAPDAKTMPVAERRTEPAEPALGNGVAMAGAAIVTRLLEQMHELGVSWTEVRDSAEGKGKQIAEQAALPKLPAGARVNQLTTNEALRLKEELARRIEDKKAKAAKRAETRARRELDAQEARAEA